MARVLVQTDSGRLVECIDTDDGAPGRDVLDRVARALREAAEAESRALAAPPPRGGIATCLREARELWARHEGIGSSSGAARRIELAQAARAREAEAIALAGPNLRRYAREHLSRSGGDTDAAARATEATLVASGYAPMRATAELARLLVTDAAERASAADDARRD